MTGFARVRRALGGGELVFSIKSVNHRGLDMHFHMPAELDPLEAGVRTAIKKGVARGHLQIHVTLSRAPGDAACDLNRPLLEAYVAAFRQAAREYQVGGEPDLNAAFRIPGMLQGVGEGEAGTETGTALAEVAAEAVAALNLFREREGAIIAAEMRERCAAVCELTTRMEQIRTGATAVFQKRLKERLSDLLRGVAIEPQRLAQEAAILAERSDVSEELIRLKTHAGQVEAMLAGSGEVGKRLDFLLQEMNRETNTILSKTGGLGDLGLTITDLALAAKAEIDKIREQSLNLE